MDIAWLIFIALCMACVTYNMWQPAEPWRAPDTIIERASMDLRVIGCYDEHLRVSVKHWVYGILVTLYRQSRGISGNDIVRNWYKENCIDEQEVILIGITDAYDKFMIAIQEFQQSQEDSSFDGVQTLYASKRSNTQQDTKQPNFKVSPEFDYHNLPKTILFNDRLNAQSLIEQIDSIIGGVV